LTHTYNVVALLFSVVDGRAELHGAAAEFSAGEVKAGCKRSL
jgi:hypothetical protein